MLAIRLPGSSAIPLSGRGSKRKKEKRKKEVHSSGAVARSRCWTRIKVELSNNGGVGPETAGLISANITHNRHKHCGKIVSTMR